MKVKEWITNNKKRIAAVLVLLVVLAAAFWYGGSGAGSHGWNVGGAKQTSSEETESFLESESETESETEHISESAFSEAETKEQFESEAQTETEKSAAAASENGNGQAEQAGNSQAGNAQPQPGSGNSTGETSGSNAQGGQQTAGQASGSQAQPTAPTQAAAPAPTQAAAPTCTISISCRTVWNHADQLTPGLAETLPADGQILGDTVVTFTQGESVFDVLQCVCRERGIQMESSFTPAYNSAYIEGIHNLYEFDCGSLSGWMYSVNGVFPNYGCSGYTVQNGDVIRWVYTCDLGADVGGGSATR